MLIARNLGLAEHNLTFRPIQMRRLDNHVIVYTFLRQYMVHLCVSVVLTSMLYKKAVIDRQKTIAK